jgi:hypothetical protein
MLLTGFAFSVYNHMKLIFRSVNMPELKYAKYIVLRDLAKPPSAGRLKRREEQLKSGNYLESTHMLSLNDTIANGALYCDTVWLWHKNGAKGVETEIAHTHDFDEILGFMGSRRDNPKDLDAEIEFWLGDEKYMITQSCLIFSPRNIPHCPLIFHRIDSPILFFSVGNGTSYTRATGSEEQA